MVDAERLVDILSRIQKAVENQRFEKAKDILLDEIGQASELYKKIQFLVERKELLKGLQDIVFKGGIIRNNVRAIEYIGTILFEEIDRGEIEEQDVKTYRNELYELFKLISTFVETFEDLEAAQRESIADSTITREIFLDIPTEGLSPDMEQNLEVLSKENSLLLNRIHELEETVGELRQQNEHLRDTGQKYKERIILLNENRQALRERFMDLREETIRLRAQVEVSCSDDEDVDALPLLDEDGIYSGGNDGGEDDGSFDEHILEGDDLFSQGRYEDARKVYERLLARDIENGTVWFKIARCFDEEGRRIEALQCYDKSTEYDPMNAEGWYRKGMLLAIRKKLRQALTCFETAYETRKDAVYAEEVGKTLGRLGKYEEALVTFETLLTDGHQGASLFRGKALVLAKLHRYEDAVTEYKKAIDRDGRYHQAYFGLATSSQALNRKNEALSAYEKALQIEKGKIDYWFGFGNLLVEMGRDKDALRAFQKALKIDPKDARVLSNLGSTLSRTHRYPEALKAFDKALKQDPGSVESMYNRANALFKLDRLGEAEICYETVLGLDPMHVGALQNLGECLTKMGKKKEGQRYIKQAKSAKRRD